MAGKSSIEWTDASWNPTRGCSLVSPGCLNCYAMKFAHRFSGKGMAYAGLTRIGNTGPTWTSEVRTIPEMLDFPLRLRKPHRIFVNSTSDLFHEDVPDAYIAAVFGIMAAAPRHTFQILTKRADRMRQWFSWPGGPYRGSPRERWMWCLNEAGYLLSARASRGWRKDVDPPDAPLPNVWLGVSVEDQQRADERIPHLLRTPAAVRFLSCEPLLGPVDLSRFIACPECKGSGTVYENHEGYASEALGCQGCMGEKPLHWVIVGGESGPGARPCAVEWVEDLLAQCKTAHVPAFCKQLGAVVVSEARTAPADCFGKPPEEKYRAPDGTFWAWRMGMDDRKGGDPAEWPEALRVRQFPEASR